MTVEKIKLFDFRQQSWGWAIHNCNEKENDHYTFTGHGRGIKESDYIILSTVNEGMCLMKITSISYLRDPKDMFKAEGDRLCGDKITDELELQLKEADVFRKSVKIENFMKDM